jgi:hypothetical protein
MDSEQREHLEQLQRIYQQRLRVLEKQSAMFGSTTSPEVQIEIKEFQEKITHTEAQLTGSGKIIQQGDTNTVIVNTSSNRQWIWVIVGSASVFLLVLMFFLGNRLANPLTNNAQQPSATSAPIAIAISSTLVYSPEKGLSQSVFCYAPISVW